MMMEVSAQGVPCQYNLTREVDDPFEKHFAKPDEARLSKCIQDIKSDRWGTASGLIDGPWHRMIKQPSTFTLYPVVLAGTSITRGLQSMNVRIPSASDYMDSG